MTITSDGCTLRFRSPTTKDLLAVRNAATEEEAMRELIQRCVLEGDGREDGEAMYVDVERQVADRIADTDPLTDLTFALQCPLCDHEWNETFDIVSYLWMEIEEVARALLDDVHRLASSYGWSEAQILTLSDARRSHYLALIDAYAEAKVSVRTRHTGKRGLS